MPHPRVIRSAPESESYVAGELFWTKLREAAAAAAKRDRTVANYIRATVLDHDSFADGLRHLLAERLANSAIDHATLATLIGEVLTSHPDILDAVQADLIAVRQRDPACPDLLIPFLFFKGFQAVQVYRVSHVLWEQERLHAAGYLQSRASEVFAVDIHPAAKI